MSAAKHTLPERYEVTHDGRVLSFTKWRGEEVRELAWGTTKQNADDRAAHGRTSRGAKHSDAIKASNQAEGTRAFRRQQKESANV